MRVSRLSWVPAIVILIAGTLWGVSAARKMASMEERLAAREAARPVPSESSAVAETVDRAELERLRAARLEWLTLRGQIADLRRAAQVAAQGPTQEVAILEQRAAAARASAEKLRQAMAFEDEAKQRRQQALAAAAWVKGAVERGRGRVPQNWAEVEAVLQAPLEPGDSDASQRWFHFWASTAFESREVQTQFEILPVGDQVDPRPGGDRQTGTVLVLRERQAREMPSGGWVRLYGFLNGGIEEARSTDGSFTEWEREAGAQAAGRR